MKVIEDTLLQTLRNSTANWTACEAEALRCRIYNELEGTSVACFALDQSFVRVGVLLAEFKAKEFWRAYPDLYKTFDDFISELKIKFKRGRTQLYSYLTVAEVLLPTIDAEKLEQMGISKALELKRAMKKLEGKPLPSVLLDAALDSTKTTKELRGTIGQALNLEPDQAGTWLDLDGFFMTPEERKEFKDAFLATEALLGLTRETADHIRRKEVILTWMREWYGTHAAEVNGAKQPVNVAPVLVQSAHAIIEPADDELDACPTGPYCTQSCLHGFPSHD